MWIDSTDLKLWAKRRDCQGNLPRLISNLIRATTSDISKLHFPAGDNVSHPGWDGILETSESNEYIPEGFSVWEMGCNRDVKSKANNDYEKRKKAFPGNPSETTYVFVSPRAWVKKDEWCEEKRRENFWKDVKAYNSTDLEGWIEQAPAVGIWLSQHLEKYPKGVKSLIDWWNEWSSSTNPNIAKELVLAGREDQLKEIKELLNSQSSEIIVQASTIDEPIAFLASVIDSLPDDESDFYFSKRLKISLSKNFATCSE